MSESNYMIYYSDHAGNQYAIVDWASRRLRRNGLRGFGMIRAEVAGKRRPYRDGLYYMGPPYTPGREMQIALDVHKESWGAFQADLRTMLNRYSPYRSTGTNAMGTLTLRDRSNGVQRAIDCWLIEVMDPERRNPPSGVVTLTFYAPWPFFRDPIQRREVFGLAGQGGVAFPIEFTETGVVFSASDVDMTVVADCRGDVPTRPVIRVNGPGDDPVVENVTTGQKTELDLSLETGDYVDINMDDSTIVMHDASENATINAISTRSEESRFWEMIPGGNELHVEMTNVTTGSIVVSWYDLFLSGF